MLRQGLHLLLGLLALLFAVTSAGAPVFPVRASADQRYLVDRAGDPFPILGRTAWFVLSLTVAEYRMFIDDSSARGYNAVELHVLNHDPRGNHPPFDGTGHAPFLRRLDGVAWNGRLGLRNGSEAPDFTTPNEAYWSFVDGFLAHCESKGILVLLFPAYTGYQGGDQGWMQEMVANGPARLQSYGAWIATRYRKQNNLVWMMGGDMQIFDTAQTAVEAALLGGLKSVPRQQSTMFSAEWSSNSIATDQPSFGGAMTLNSAYSWSGNVNREGRRAYSFSRTMPAFLLEEPYDEEGPDGTRVNRHATQPVRRFQWWGWLATIGGYVAGNGYVWPFRSSLDPSWISRIVHWVRGWASTHSSHVPLWTAHLDTPATRDMSRLNAFIRSIKWYELVPSGLAGMRTLVVTSGGSSVNADDYVASAALPDGTLAVAYIPPAHAGPISFDMAALSGPTRARWLDPTSGAYFDIGTGLPNAGARLFTPRGANSAGDNDWVLVLDTATTSSMH